MKSIGCHYSLQINYDNVNFTSSQVSELFPAAIMSVVFVKSFKRWARTKHEVRVLLRGTLRCNECGTSCHNTTLWLPYRAVGTKIKSGVNRTCLQEGKVVYCLIKSWSRKVGTFWGELDLWLFFCGTFRISEYGNTYSSYLTTAHNLMKIEKTAIIFNLFLDHAMHDLPAQLNTWQSHYIFACIMDNFDLLLNFWGCKAKNVYVFLITVNGSI